MSTCRLGPEVKNQHFQGPESILEGDWEHISFLFQEKLWAGDGFWPALAQRPFAQKLKWEEILPSLEIRGVPHNKRIAWGWVEELDSPVSPKPQPAQFAEGWGDQEPEDIFVEEPVQQFPGVNRVPQPEESQRAGVLVSIDVWQKVGFKTNKLQGIIPIECFPHPHEGGGEGSDQQLPANWPWLRPQGLVEVGEFQGYRGPLRDVLRRGQLVRAETWPGSHLLS